MQEPSTSLAQSVIHKKSSLKSVFKEPEVKSSGDSNCNKFNSSTKQVLVVKTSDSRSSGVTANRKKDKEGSNSLVVTGCKENENIVDFAGPFVDSIISEALLKGDIPKTSSLKIVVNEPGVKSSGYINSSINCNKSNTSMKQVVLVKEYDSRSFGLRANRTNDEEESNSLVLTDCIEYENIVDFAEAFVDSIISEAKRKIKEHIPKLTIETKLGRPSGSTFIWPTIEEFDIETGLEALEEYVSSWPVNEDWRFFINYLDTKSGECADIYKYEVIFSIPCKEYPIPQATASIYFAIEASRVKPPHCTVDVTYQFEGNRLTHTPGLYGFNENWLFNILYAKIRLFESVPF